MEQNLSKKTRTESDLIGSREVPESVPAPPWIMSTGNWSWCFPSSISLQAFKIASACSSVNKSSSRLATAAPIFVIANAWINRGYSFKWNWGAGTTTNMNANEVIANRALELMGHQRGEYQYCSPNDHVNRSQSTNDAYPTAIHIGLYYTHLKLVKHFEVLIESFRKKATEFAHVIKMGRTQLEDAVPMTLGQTFNGFASILRHEVKNLDSLRHLSSFAVIPSIHKVRKVSNPFINKSADSKQHCAITGSIAFSSIWAASPLIATQRSFPITL